MASVVKYTTPSTLVARSDIDHHQNIRSDQLGDHLGGGVFLDPKPVVVERDPSTGRIARLLTLDEHRQKQERIIEALRPDQIEEAKEALPILQPLQTSARDKLVAILAGRLFKYYEGIVMDLSRLNPLRDGIPLFADGSWVLEMDPRRGSEIQRLQAPPGVVYEWLKAMVGSRASLTNKRYKWNGIQPDLGLIDKNLTITRKVSIS